MLVKKGIDISFRCWRLPRFAIPFVLLSFFVIPILTIVHGSSNAFATASTLTVTITNSILLDIAPSGSSGVFGHSDTTTPNINIRTTNGSGYMLCIKAGTSGANNNALINTEDNTKIIPSITTSGGISEVVYASDSSYDNTWAYRPSKINSSVNSNYLPAPNSDATSILLDQTTISNPTADNAYNIALGVRVNNSLAPGAYTNTFTIIATANPIPYTITYNQNTSDTVTDFPTNESGTTYGEMLAMSSQVPVRQGYDFKGWCTVQVVDDAVCTGILYNPDGAGTNLDWTIDQTQPSASLSVYATWETAVSPNSCNPSGTTIGTNTSTDIRCMQDFASLSPSAKTALVSSMTAEAQYALLDARDDKSYMVSKLADGRVWMTQNLDLNLDSNVTYTDSDTDLGWNGSSYGTASWSPERSTYTASDTFEWGLYNSTTGEYDGLYHPQSYDPGDQYWNGNLSNWDDWAQYYNSCQNEIGCDETLYPLSTYVSSSGIPQYHIGNYYNFSAAVATNDGSIYYGSTPVEQSICPVGWTLPSATMDFNTDPAEMEGEFMDLWIAYGWTPSGFNDISILLSAPLYYIPSGTIEQYQTDVGFDNSFMTPTPLWGSNNVRVYFHTSGQGTTEPLQISTRNYGGMVRCIARE